MESGEITVRPIRNEADYEWNLARIDALMDAEPGTPEGDELDVLATLVENWEQRQYPIEPLDPVDFLKGAMELMGKGQSVSALFRDVMERFAIGYVDPRTTTAPPRQGLDALIGIS